MTEKEEKDFFKDYDSYEGMGAFKYLMVAAAVSIVGLVIIVFLKLLEVL